MHVYCLLFRLFLLTCPITWLKSFGLAYQLSQIDLSLTYHVLYPLPVVFGQNLIIVSYYFLIHLERKWLHFFRFNFTCYIFFPPYTFSWFSSTWLSKKKEVRKEQKNTNFFCCKTKNDNHLHIFCRELATCLSLPKYLPLNWIFIKFLAIHDVSLEMSRSIADLGCMI